ncbi:unnamed protein product [Gongylonema pulchrum]|uniref:HOOK domain-containing protein n=1 Tax=Gongylonema pulchrum TaxID=637853 RepID=A0A183D8W4_9BILA|nr:unnamed protein product [Gongylonema pulchrum]
MFYVCVRLGDFELNLEARLGPTEEYRKQCQALEKDLEEVRSALAISKSDVEKFRAENEKLLAKASLEDEVVTLATSLQSARDEISD